MPWVCLLGGASHGRAWSTEPSPSPVSKPIVAEGIDYRLEVFGVAIPVRPAVTALLRSAKTIESDRADPTALKVAIEGRKQVTLGCDEFFKWQEEVPDTGKAKSVGGFRSPDGRFLLLVVTAPFGAGEIEHSSFTSVVNLRTGAHRIVGISTEDPRWREDGGAVAMLLEWGVDEGVHMVAVLRPGVEENLRLVKVPPCDWYRAEAWTGSRWVGTNLLFECACEGESVLRRARVSPDTLRVETLDPH